MRTITPLFQLVLRSTILISLILLSGLLGACNASSQDGVPTEPGLFPEPSFIAPTLDVLPTEDDPELILVLVGTGEEDSEIADLAVPILEEMAENEQMSVIKQETISNSDLYQSARLVVIIGDVEGAEDIIQSTDIQQYLLIGNTGLLPEGNVTTIGGDGLPYDQREFLAGYLVAVLSPEWRTGMIRQTSSDHYDDYYERGITYFCGLCRVEVPPYYEYPIIETIEPGDTEGLNQAIQSLATTAVDVIFVKVDTATMSIESLPEGMRIIGTYPPLEVRNQGWTASIEFDLETPITIAWPQVLAGNGGQEYPIGLVFTNINESNLSQGKLDHVNSILGSIVLGQIGVEAIP